MAALDYALISPDEWRDRWTAGGNDQAPNIEAAVLAATYAIEKRCDRLFVSRGPITEYHSIHDNLREIYLGQWPYITLTTVHESTATPPVYDATTLLTSGTGYQAVKPDRLRRLSAGGPTCWARGSRVAQVVYTAGYADTASVPADLKQVCFVIAASMFAEADKKRFGVSSMTDGSGAYQRFVGYFTPALDEMLDDYKRRDMHRTWELAA